MQTDSGKNKTVLITGSSTGIGRTTALYFQERGWYVAATMRSPEKGHELTGWPNVICHALDVTNAASIGNAVQETLARFGRIDVLVNNAGYAAIGPFEASTSEQVQRQFDTNVLGLMAVTKAVLPHMREQRSGVIINISSMAGRLAFPLYSLYHATKWAVEGFSESLQFELEEFGISVKLVEPGVIKTDFYDRSADVLQKEGLSAYDRFVKRVMPKLEAAGTKGVGPEEVAAVIFKAATDGSSQLRYPVSLQSKALLLLRWALPGRVFKAAVKSQLMK